MNWLKQRSAEITIILVTVAIGAGVYLYAHRGEGELRASKERGAAIVAALEQHRAREGTYPETLDGLTPGYIAAIEPPTWGLKRWRYRRYTPADVSQRAAGDTATLYFQLSVAANEGGYPVLYYDFTARRWVLNN